MASFLKWLAAAALAIGVASTLAGELPPRVRLLLLFSVGFGLLAGWGAAALADEFGLGRSRRDAILVSVLTAAGLVNIAWTGYRQTVAAARKITESDPQQLLSLRMLEGTMDVDPVLKQRYREELARLQPNFADYLAVRLQRFGTIPAPWPAIAWSVELLLGGIAATWMFRRGIRPPSVDKSELQNPKSETVDPLPTSGTSHPSAPDPGP